jgi:hypothetical protein
MAIAGSAKSIDELVGALNCPQELVPRDLEPCDVLVVTDAKPLESKTSHSAFRCCYLAQFLNRNRIAVCKSG